jgi:putative FmdB family regulatory protein
MPIYEFRCNRCRNRVSIFQRRIGAPAAFACSKCGSNDLTRLISAFAVVRGEEAIFDSMDDDSLFSGVDENDPKSMAAWARKMSSRFGEGGDPEFDEMIDRMEAGQTPDELGDEDGDDSSFDGE